MNTTVNLVAEIKKGRPVVENVLVEQLASNRYLLVRSPGLVPGLAAGDEFELTNTQIHGYRLLKRGGNICVQMFFPDNTNDFRDGLVTMAQEVHGWLDGEVAWSGNRMLVFTFPARTGFPAIENVMSSAQAGCPGCEWSYGNIYDLSDGVTPLNWWTQALS